MSTPEQQGIHINTPPEYELKLLTALAYFLGRKLSSQASACLSMYLRQSEPRIMSQVRYYAHKATKATGKPISEYDLLDLLYENPEHADQIFNSINKVHLPNDINDVFEASENG